MHSLLKLSLRCLLFLLPLPVQDLLWAGQPLANPRARKNRRPAAVPIKGSAGETLLQLLHCAAPWGHPWWHALGALLLPRSLRVHCPRSLEPMAAAVVEESRVARVVMPQLEVAGSDCAIQRLEEPRVTVTAAFPVESEARGVGCLAGAARVQITVAIEEVEDKSQLEKQLLYAVEGGSCSEDDSSRCDRYSGAVTSGGENDADDLDQDWKPPEQELIQKLVAQTEYYFSDENLEKDAFLLKHVRRNKMGYVSVKLLTSFKKVKHLSRDWRTTAYALKYSDTLELNEAGTKIRRKAPVPVFPSENLPSKMLLVYDLHLLPELQSVNDLQENGGKQEKLFEHLLKLFRNFGVITSLRILKPGRDLPPDIKRFSSRYAQIGTKECAVVEFDEVEIAIKAHELMDAKKDETGMKVILIGMKPPKKKLNRNRDEPNKSLHKNKSLNKRVEELQGIGDESPVYSSSDPDSNPTSPLMDRKPTTANKLSNPTSPLMDRKPTTANKLSPSTYQNNHLSPNDSPRTSPWNSPSVQHKVLKSSPLAEDGTVTELLKKGTDYSSDSSITPSGSPWVQRRRSQTVACDRSPAGSPMLGRKIQNADGLPPGVLRLPKGPDGTKGFHIGRERNKAMQNS
ncbi:la-related protein 6 [Microcaecilia unicolor]|uniref:La-related protein 6 n=1 Tax=Microcaecilia unicolor TaxID=1415580 RepID=A0A6P7WMH9_9AMPH|nr:la-related protein 6 [Microcaecilia unicolor]